MEPKPKRRGGKLFKSALAVIILLGVYSIGVNVGNGTLSFGGSNNKTLNGSLPSQPDYSSVNQIYSSLKDNYDGKLTEQQIEDGLKHGLAESAKDPYTVYFTQKEAKDFNDQLNNSFAGIGARLSKDSDGYLVIGEAIEGFPAQKAGLQSQDIISKINGSDATKLTLDDAITKIRGPAGSEVKLEVVRDHAQTLDFKITRQEIKIPSITSKILDNNIGYIQISTFADDTTDLAQKAATQLKNQNVKGIVLDLRDDPGGLLNAAEDVSSLWLPKGKTILQEKRGTTVEDTGYASGNDLLNGIPTVVLINGGSASASEITAGALHDNKAAYLIGEKSYGKGVVQQLINFKDGSQLKVTVASWYRPNGQNINKKGITPDQTVKITAEDAKASNDTQLKAAQDYLANR
jgi:carboxyl-terminal processing protease